MAEQLSSQEEDLSSDDDDINLGVTPNRGSTRKNAIFLKCLWTNSEDHNSLKSMSI